MSHFTVLVPAKDEEELEEKLMPYHEFECTGIDNQYVQDVDITDEVTKEIKKHGLLEGGLKYFGLEDRVVSLETEVDKGGHHKYGYAVVRDGNLIKAVDRTNPNKKWDWYSVGGRWTGLLRLKPGKLGENGRPGLMTRENTDTSKCDVALAGDVDWFAMEEAHIRTRLEIYRYRQKFIKMAGDLNNPPSQIYKKSVELFEDKTPRGDNARKIFVTFERCLQWEYAEYLAHQSESKDIWFDEWKEIKRFLMAEEEFTQTVLANAQTYAFIDLEGEWNQRGEMGWFGCSDETRGTQDYDSAWWEFVKTLPVDRRVYVVDCHI